jgi:rRNA maturation protein Nop10
MNQQDTPQIDPNLLNMMASAQSQQSNSVYTVPTMLVDLPSRGLLYSEGHPLYGKETIEIKYMTTKEEDILLNSSYIEKGVVLDRLLESVILDKRVKVESLLSGDKSALQIACRINAYGEQYEFNYACSSCGEKNQASVDLGKLRHSEIDFKKIKSDAGILIELPVSKKIVKARILTGSDEEKILERIKQKKKHGFSEQFIIERYRQIFESIDGNEDPMFVASFVQNMSIRDSRYFSKEYSKMLPAVEFVFSDTCSECGDENKGGIPVGLSFFYPE